MFYDLAECNSMFTGIGGAEILSRVENKVSIRSASSRVNMSNGSMPFKIKLPSVFTFPISMRSLNIIRDRPVCIQAHATIA